MPEFDVRDYYCVADDGRVYSTARDAVVSEDDAAFLAWKGAGGIPSRWPRDEEGQQTDASLNEALILAGLRSPPASMPDISPRQFASGLWGDKVITFDEADAYVSVRTIPGALGAILDTLPDDDSGEPTPRKDAILLLRGATAFEFGHPLVDTVRQAQGWSGEHLRDRWTVWATL